MNPIKPFDDTPHEPAPPAADEQTAPGPAGTGPESRGIPEPPKGLKPRWQIADDELSGTGGDTAPPTDRQTSPGPADSGLLDPSGPEPQEVPQPPVGLRPRRQAADEAPGGTQAAGTPLADPRPARPRTASGPLASSGPEPQGVPEPLKGLKSLWQTADEEPRGARVMPPTRRKSTIRYQAPRERTDGRQKMMTALIPALAVVMILMFRHSLGTRPTAQAAAAPARPPVAAEVPTVEIAWTIPSVYEFNKDPKRLTSAPAVVVVETAEATDKPLEPLVYLALTGILYSADKPAAIVDTQIVHEGQQVSGATVEKIDKDGVQFERNGRRWKQSLSQ